MATVLVVEDEFAIAELLEMALADAGHHVLTAANGRQGLERLADGPRPDLVITDFMMPVLDGAGMLRAMRATEAHRDIPCVLMSAVPEESVREHVNGYAAFMGKPFRIAAAVQLVAAVLGPPPKQAFVACATNACLGVVEDASSYLLRANTLRRMMLSWVAARLPGLRPAAASPRSPPPWQAG